jgi:hypothetical protein
MSGNLTPPIFSEAVVAGLGSAGLSPPADPIPQQRDHEAGEVDVELAPIEDSCLIEELQTLRRLQNEASSSRMELIESHGRRERELEARLDQAQGIIEAGRWELARVQKLHEEQQIALNLQQEQHQLQLRSLQESLAEARRQIDRGQGDLQGLHQRCALLERECDQRERWVSNLKHQLQAAREELESRRTELTAALRRCEELELQRQQSQREHAAQVEALKQELQRAREELESRSTELAAALRRCEELELQRQQSEREHASRTEERERQRAAIREAAEVAPGTFLNDLETQRLRDELAALQQMLEELPDIYEHKFRQRLQPLLEQRDWLLHENNWLRAELPAPRVTGLPATLESEPAALAAVPFRRTLLQSVRALLPFGRLGRRPHENTRPEAEREVGSGAGADQPDME